MKYVYPDFIRAVARLEQILGSYGIEIFDPAKSPFKRAEAILLKIQRINLKEAQSDNSKDEREEWRRGFSLGDLALKLVAAHNAKPDEFKKLKSHLLLLSKDAELSLFSFSQGRIPEEQQTDFIAELHLAACCIQMMDHLEFDPPSGKKSTKGKNPDIIGQFNDRRWAIESKTLHPDTPGAKQNPEAFLSRVTDARDQIKAAIASGRAETGVVVVNMKNTVDPDSFLPCKTKDGEIYYGAHPSLDHALVNLKQKLDSYMAPITKTLLERETNLAAILTDPDKGGHPNIAPCVLTTYSVIDGIVQDGKPTYTMLRALGLEPMPADRNCEGVVFANKLNACRHDQPDHPGF